MSKEFQYPENFAPKHVRDRSPEFERRRKDILSRVDAFDEAMQFYMDNRELFPFEFDMHFPVQWRYRQLFGPRK